jgi:ABC-2 type transport system ATP-binding protein
MSVKYAIDARGVKKSYGDLKVLKGIDLQVERGTILALLGPNGAGKTTMIRIMSTLLQADGGEISIEGYNLATEAAQVRSVIGLTGQYAAVDGYLTGLENLQMIGRLYRLSTADAKQRAEELIEQFELTEAANRPVKTYSGGMKRRIDLAMSLIASPPVIFLDEPTTGLDPRSRITMWDTVRRLAKSGTTILLTTQYMEEADQLADTIVVIDNGKVIAQGTPNSLKAKVGADQLEIVIGGKSNLEEAARVIGRSGLQTDAEQRMVSIASKGGVRDLKDILGRLEAANIVVENISLRRPTLDDVFLSLTGHTATAEVAEGTNKKAKGK